MKVAVGGSPDWIGHGAIQRRASSRSSDSMTDIYINQNGRAVCLEHAGMYLKMEVAANPHLKEIDTPLDSWVKFEPEFTALFFTPSCEECRHETD